jgi:hypothetical protein
MESVCKVQLDKDLQGVEYEIPEKSIVSVKVEKGEE